MHRPISAPRSSAKMQMPRLRIFAGMGIFWLASIGSLDSVVACTYAGPALTDQQIEEYAIDSFKRSAHVFSAEVIAAGPEDWRMKVSRVYKGDLKPGQILTGRPAWHSCMTRELKANDEGIVMVTFGPDGPKFVGEFVGPKIAVALAESGLVPK